MHSGTLDAAVSHALPVAKMQPWPCWRGAAGGCFFLAGFTVAFARLCRSQQGSASPWGMLLPGMPRCRLDSPVNPSRALVPGLPSSFHP